MKDCRLRCGVVVAVVIITLSIRAGCMSLPKTEWPAGTFVVDAGDEADAMGLATVDSGEAPDAAGGEQTAAAQPPADPPKAATPNVDVDADGNPISLDRLQPKRILG